MRRHESRRRDPLCTYIWRRLQILRLNACVTRLKYNFVVGSIADKSEVTRPVLFMINLARDAGLGLPVQKGYVKSSNCQIIKNILSEFVYKLTIEPVSMLNKGVEPLYHWWSGMYDKSLSNIANASNNISKLTVIKVHSKIIEQFLQQCYW